MSALVDVLDILFEHVEVLLRCSFLPCRVIVVQKLENRDGTPGVSLWSLALVFNFSW